jgi:flagellar basal-body rod protein FlgG
MSVQTLYTAATGMEALQTKLDVIANNLANINTTSFKKDRANFEDLFYRHEMLPGIQDANGTTTPTGTSIGLGARVSSTQTDFAQGAFKQTNRELDVAIEGHGFFEVDDPGSGGRLYTRAGNFSVNGNGELVLGSASNGRRLTASVTIPADASEISISPSGIVEVRVPGQNTLQNAGQLTLSKFINPEGLLKVGENLYAETPASQPPVLQGNPGDQGLGQLRQNYLEASNVEPVRELIDLITTQRAFELNSQAVKAGDEVLQLISNLKRF